MFFFFVDEKLWDIAPVPKGVIHSGRIYSLPPPKYTCHTLLDDESISTSHRWQFAYFSGPEFKGVTLIAVILPVVVVTGLFFGIVLLMFTMKTRSGLFACYQVSHPSRKKNTKQCVLATQQTTTVDFVNNEAYQHTCQSERDHERFHRRIVSNTSGMGSQNEYSCANCSTHSQLQPPHLYDIVSIQNTIDTTTYSAMEHHVVNETVEEYVNMEAEDTTVAALPVMSLTQLQNSTETQDDEYIEVFHKSGTLV